MGFKQTIFEIVRDTSNFLIYGVEKDNPEPMRPWDPYKYHRAFVWGLSTAGGAAIAAVDQLGANAPVALVKIAVAFFAGFAFQLAVEYGLRPEDKE